MMRTIKVHEECLKNQKTHLAQQQQELVRVQARVDSAKRDIALAEQQLVRAKKLRKTCFDPERFCVGRSIVGIPDW